MMNVTQTNTRTILRYSYKETLFASQKANWRLEDIIGGDKKLDFTQPLMPESFARVEELSFLSPAEKLKLNQIRGFDYLCYVEFRRISSVGTFDRKAWPIFYLLSLSL